MSKKGAEQLAAHIKHQVPKVNTKVYRAFNKHLGYGVQVSYGRKPDYITCLNPQDWKDGKAAVEDL